MDNLGFGELSCYSGGPFRGAVTSRIDAFAGEGFRLTNYCPESQCTPTRSALLTGRHAIRSGTHSVPLGSPGGWGRIQAGRTSDEIMHVTDWFTTILHAAGLSEPADRVIDGVNQLGWLTGQTATSQREGYIYWMGPQMYAVKWHNFKLVLVAQKYMQDPAAKLPTPA